MSPNNDKAKKAFGFKSLKKAFAFDVSISPVTIGIVGVKILHKQGGFSH